MKFLLLLIFFAFTNIQVENPKDLWYERINTFRSLYEEVPQLKVDPELEERAQLIAERLHTKSIKKGDLKKHHSDANFRLGSGENLAVPRNEFDIVTIDYWHSSEGHRKVMVDKTSTHMGIGLSTKNGKIYAVLLVR